METKDLRQFTFSDVKKEGLRILDAVHKFCIENNIKYSLGYGTLIGAIRHKGYIPWDDDIDLAMPRDDYERFIRTFGNDEFGVASCFLDKNYFAPYAKVYSRNTIKRELIHYKLVYEIGFNIDIFPLDYCESKEKYERLRKREKIILFKYRCSLYKPHFGKFKNFVFNIGLLPFRKKHNKYSRKIDLYFRKHNKKNSKNYFVTTEMKWTSTKHLYDADLFDTLIEHEFEGKKYLITSKYDSMLRGIYGDYMVMPPEGKRVSDHSFVAYYKN